MDPVVVTLLFLLFAIVMFVWERIPLAVTSMIVCIGLVLTGVLSTKDAFAGFTNSNVILFVAMFIVGGALFETGMANKIGGRIDSGRNRYCGKVRVFEIQTSDAAGICGGSGR